MSRQPTLGPSAIRDQFDELAGLLDEPTTVYLIGGGALTLMELKDATRDLDLIVESETESDRLFEALRSAGYRLPDDLEEGYDDLHAAFILQRGPRRFDVFNRQVAGVLHLSEQMIDRSEELLDEGPLTGRMVTLNDIFLFKSVANREDDVDDMVVLAQAGIDTEVIMEEVMGQLELIGGDQFIRSMKHKLERLADRGYSFDIHDEVATLYDSIQEADEVERTLYTIYDAEYRFDDFLAGVPRSRLRDQVDPDIDLQSAIDWLTRTGRIDRAADGTLVPLSDV